MWPGQRTTHRTAHAAFPGGELSALERRGAAVRKADGLGAVVGGEADDGVVELAHVLELLDHDADVVVHLLHAGLVHAPVLAAGLADHGLVLVRQHGRDVHARRVIPDEERLVGLLGVVAIEEVDDLGRDLLVHGLGALQRQRALILARLVLRRAVGGLAPDHRARWRQAGRRLRVDCSGNLRRPGIGVFLHGGDDALLGRALVDVREAHALHRVQVIEVAPELLETVRRR